MAVTRYLVAALFRFGRQRMLSRASRAAAVVAAGLALALAFPSLGFSQNLRPGDRVQLPSGDVGTIDSITNGVARVRIEVQAEVPLSELKPDRRSPPPVAATGQAPQGVPAQLGGGFGGPQLGGDVPAGEQVNRAANQVPPRGPQPVESPRLRSQSPLVGTWLANDRALVIQDAERFRVFWTDKRGSVRADDGTYRVQSMQDGRSLINFQSKDQTWPWKLIEVNSGQSLTIAHDEAGRRRFQHVATNENHPLAGNWTANYTRSDGRYGTASVILYRDGMFVIDELDEAGRFDHRVFGSWQADAAQGTFTITFPFEGQLHTVVGRMEDQAADRFTWNFKTIFGLGYEYRCRKK